MSSEADREEVAVPCSAGEGCIRGQKVTEVRRSKVMGGFEGEK